MTLETKHLSRTVVDRVLVSDISVQVQPGEVLAVVGPSGAGKSSFLRLLNRLDEPTGGTVCLNGQDYRELAPRELRPSRRHVMQMAYLFPGTVAANVAFGAAAVRRAAPPGANCFVTRPGRLVRVPGTRCEQPVGRRGATCVASSHAGERS